MSTRPIMREWIDEKKEEILQDFTSILEIPALSPDFGGEGELEKCIVIESLLNKWNLPFTRIEIPDSRIQSQIRPSLIITYNPTKKEGPFIVVVAHMDVVPVGDLEAWDSPPFTPTIKDGNLYGRGSEDNGQAVIASLYALRYLKDHDIIPPLPIKVVLVADEEVGSKFGIQPLIKQGHFSSTDLVLVPDGGIASGLQIQIGEKAGLWVKITIIGEQGHAARPEDAQNAHRLMNMLAVRLDEALHTEFHHTNPLFISPVSTFEPTKRDNHVENVNTLPGIDTVYFDCRLIPDHSQQTVKIFITKFSQDFQNKNRCQVHVEFIAEGPFTPPHSPDLPVIQRLRSILEEKFHASPKLVGLGGGSCAAHFRSNNTPAIVWGHMAHVAHSVDEYCVLEYLWDDIEIYINFMLAEGK